MTTYKTDKIEQEQHQACATCGEPLMGPNQAQCEHCGRLFHFGYLNAPGAADCGGVYFY